MKTTKKKENQKKNIPIKFTLPGALTKNKGYLPYNS